MTSTNIIFLIHMKNKYYEKLEKIKQDKIKLEKIKQDKIKQDIEYLEDKTYLDKEDQYKGDLDKEDQYKGDLDKEDQENLKNCKGIFKNYLNYLEKVSIKTFESMELQFI